MKPDAAPSTVPENPTRVEFQVRFSLGPKGRRRVREAPVVDESGKGIDSTPDPQLVASPQSVPKIARLLVLGHHFERLVRDGVVKDYAEIARLTSLTRARVTQIVGLTLLSPAIQDAVLSLSPGSTLTERGLRPLISCVEWRSQRALWRCLAPGLAIRSAR